MLEKKRRDIWVYGHPPPQLSCGSLSYEGEEAPLRSHPVRGSVRALKRTPRGGREGVVRLDRSTVWAETAVPSRFLHMPLTHMSRLFSSTHTQLTIVLSTTRRRRHDQIGSTYRRRQRHLQPLAMAVIAQAAPVAALPAIHLPESRSSVAAAALHRPRCCRWHAAAASRR